MHWQMNTKVGIRRECALESNYLSNRSGPDGPNRIGAIVVTTKLSPLQRRTVLTNSLAGPHGGGFQMTPWWLSTEIGFTNRMEKPLRFGSLTTAFLRQRAFVFSSETELLFPQR
jgi:hypothetical protein